MGKGRKTGDRITVRLPNLPGNEPEDQNGKAGEERMWWSPGSVAIVTGTDPTASGAYQIRGRGHEETKVETTIGAVAAEQHANHDWTIGVVMPEGTIEVVDGRRPGNQIEEVRRTIEQLLADPEEAVRRGRTARSARQHGRSTTRA